MSYWKRPSHLPGLLSKFSVDSNSNQPVWTEAEQGEKTNQHALPENLSPEKLGQNFLGKQALGKADVDLPTWNSQALQYDWSMVVVKIGKLWWKWGLWSDIGCRPQASLASLLLVLVINISYITFPWEEKRHGPYPWDAPSLIKRYGPCS